MIKIVTQYKEINKEQWNDLLYHRSAVASFFQSPEAYELYEPFDWAESSVFAVEEEGRLTGVIVVVLQFEGRGVKKYLTSRAIINGGPLLDDNITEEALRVLLQTTLKGLKGKCNYVETRNYNDYSRWRPAFEAVGFCYQPHYNFHIDTSSFEEVEQRFSKSRRYEIKSSFKEGAYIDEDMSSLSKYYALLDNVYKTKIHTPLLPLEFFQYLGQQPYSRIFIIHAPDGQVIGGQVSVYLKGKAGYAWYCCGKDHDYKKIHPSVMANYSGIKYAAEHGYPRFDMMGAGSPDDGGYGVRDFKAQFGGELVEHGRFLFLCRPLIYKAAKWALNIKKKL